MHVDTEIPKVPRWKHWKLTEFEYLRLAVTPPVIFSLSLSPARVRLAHNYLYNYQVNKLSIALFLSLSVSPSLSPGSEKTQREDRNEVHKLKLGQPLWLQPFWNGNVGFGTTSLSCHHFPLMFQFGEGCFHFCLLAATRAIQLVACCWLQSYLQPYCRNSLLRTKSADEETWACSYMGNARIWLQFL